MQQEERRVLTVTCIPVPELPTEILLFFHTKSLFTLHLARNLNGLFNGKRKYIKLYLFKTHQVSLSSNTIMNVNFKILLIPITYILQKASVIVS